MKKVKLKLGSEVIGPFNINFGNIHVNYCDYSPDSLKTLGFEIIPHEPFRFEAKVEWAKYDTHYVFPINTDKSLFSLLGKKGTLVFTEDES